MNPSNFRTKSVKVLQQYLKETGVIFSDQSKADLIELHQNCIKLNTEVDHDDLFENRDKTLKDKMLLHNEKYLEQPKTVSRVNDLSMLPPLGTFDLYSYYNNF